MIKLRSGQVAYMFYCPYSTNSKFYRLTVYTMDFCMESEK